MAGALVVESIMVLWTLLILTMGARAQSLTLPQQKIPLLPPQFQGQVDPDSAYDDPCQVTLQNQFYMDLSADGAGWPVADAITEANTGALVGLGVSTEQNTDIEAQLAFNKCVAEREARRRNIETATEPGEVDSTVDAGQESQVPTQ